LDAREVGQNQRNTSVFKAFLTCPYYNLIVDAADDSGCFHLCTILPILHFPMLCSYYVEAAGKYTPARPVFAKQGRL
jgi:hypothetical protein